jgi:hypothetical protein
MDPSENAKVSASGQVWGGRRRNVFAGARPAVKAWDGPLPEGITGYEFYTRVRPDPDQAPGWPQWSEGQPGVVVIEEHELVAISVIVTKQHDSR